MVGQVKDRLLDLYTVALAAGLGYLAYRAILSHSAPRAPRGVGSLGPIEPGDILPDAPAGTVPVASDPVTTVPAPGNNVLTSPMIGEATEQLCDLSPLYSFGSKCVGQTWTAGSATSLNVLAAMGTPVDWTKWRRLTTAQAVAVGLDPAQEWWGYDYRVDAVH